MNITLVTPAPKTITWPVGTIARVRRKNASPDKVAQYPDGYLRFHALLGIPAPGTNVDADNPKTLINTTSVVVNLATGSVKGFTPDDYDVFEVFDTMTVVGQ
jgi:hypothetical protein